MDTSNDVIKSPIKELSLSKQLKDHNRPTTDRISV